ncbi:3-oxoacyl-[acyl-carrier-protein] reductase FabG [Pseudolycoriella hygida]|uniref:3-oxoacyl-[acyl-carrier-protein] reductase FabG n=1 Tax=Pseudolycoriella hygida TaxID=35572 RepID=A0A9Q0S9M2_9DIPT|nr:3-oxoacyl-[acyl-carrier-protein] reductase FabG [Pseudolycoriella hygida]
MKAATICFVITFMQCISIIRADTDYIEITPNEFRGVKNALDFRGKVVLVTGSNSGIGGATVRLFSYLGAKVVVTGRNVTRVKEVVNDCYRLSPDRIKPLGIALDLTIPGNIGKLINETIKRYKKMDILVNNAGIGLFSAIQDPNFNKVYFQSRITNEEVPLEVTRQATPHLTKAKGSIVFISSISARHPMQSGSAYSMQKNAVIALAMTLTHDLGPNVRVNVISPGTIDGTHIFRSLPPDLRPRLLKNACSVSSLKRRGVPIDIAKAIVFLASPLSGFINGQVLQLDGGAYIPLF